MAFIVVGFALVLYSNYQLVESFVPYTGVACRCGNLDSLMITAWINHCLHSTGLRVHDQETDLDDGLILLKQLETLSSGKKILGRLGMLHNPFTF